jgi:hypothetical protein
MAYIDMGTGVLPNERFYTISAWINVQLGGGSMYKSVVDASTSRPWVPVRIQRRQHRPTVVATDNHDRRRCDGRGRSSHRRRTSRTRIGWRDRTPPGSASRFRIPRGTPVHFGK